VVGLALVALALSSCGLRVPHSEVRSATAAAEGNGSGGTGGTAGSANNSVASGSNGNNSTSSGGSATSPGAGAVGPSASSGSSGSAGAPSGSSGAAVSSGSNSSTGSATGPVTGGSGAAVKSASCGSGSNGGPTAPGVTANTITVGNVSDVGGPVPGLFAGGPIGVEAYFNYINSQGGICGRQLKLNPQDDSLQCSNNEAAYADSVKSVFAYVGSWSLDDFCGANIMKSNPGVPMVQTYLSPDMQNLPNAFGEAPYSQLVNTGPFLYFKQKYPQDITNVGTLVGNQASAVAAWQHAKTAITSIGYKVTYEDDFPPAQSNFTEDVIRMKAQNIKMVILLSVNAPDAAIFASEAAQQGFHPDVWLCPVCYFGGYVSESGGAASVNGQYAYVAFAQFLGSPSVPEAATFAHWLSVTNPNFVPDEFAAYSWANAALFVHTLEQVGPDLTQAKVLAALKGTTTFTDNGMVTAANVGARSPSNCYNILQVQSGNWVRVDDPPTGFRCDGTYVP
jgi:ABC-type branched-subunit amino acid transport system substrate-binding protein